MMTNTGNGLVLRLLQSRHLVLRLHQSRKCLWIWSLFDFGSCGLQDKGATQPMVIDGGNFRAPPLIAKPPGSYSKVPSSAALAESYNKDFPGLGPPGEPNQGDSIPAFHRATSSGKYKLPSNMHNSQFDMRVRTGQLAKAAKCNKDIGSVPPARTFGPGKHGFPVDLS